MMLRNHIVYDEWHIKLLWISYCTGRKSQIKKEDMNDVRRRRLTTHIKKIQPIKMYEVHQLDQSSKWLSMDGVSVHILPGSIRLKLEFSNTVR